MAFTLFEAKTAGEVEALYRQTGRLKPDKIVFDGQAFSPKALLGAKPPAGTYSLSTRDGLSLSLARDGRVAGVRVGRSAPVRAPGCRAVNGVLLRGEAGKKPPPPVGRGRT